jgi:hypothetical protein
MQFLKRLLRVLAVLFATYILASVIEAVILVTITLSKGQGATLTLNTADMVSLYVIWMVLYVVVGRRFVRRRRSV